VFIEAKNDGGGGDNWTTGAISRAKLQLDHHHQHTDIQIFTGRMPFLSPNQHCQALKENIFLIVCFLFTQTLMLLLSTIWCHAYSFLYVTRCQIYVLTAQIR